LSKDTLFTDSNGRATVWFTDSVKSTVTLTATCFGEHAKIKHSGDRRSRQDPAEHQDRSHEGDTQGRREGQYDHQRDHTQSGQQSIRRGECVKFITTSGTIMGANATCNDPGKSATDAQGLARRY